MFSGGIEVEHCLKMGYNMNTLNSMLLWFKPFHVSIPILYPRVFLTFSGGMEMKHWLEMIWNTIISVAVEISAKYSEKMWLFFIGDGQW